MSIGMWREEEEGVLRRYYDDEQIPSRMAAEARGSGWAIFADGEDGAILDTYSSGASDSFVEILDLLDQAGLADAALRRHRLL